MEDKYHEKLIQLMTLSDEEYEEIPECRKEVITERDTTLIQSGEQRWLFDLCRSISPSKEVSGKAGRPYPRYISKKSVKIGGEGFLLTAWDMWRRGIVVMLKIPLPVFSTEKKKEEAERAERKDNPGPQTSKIVRGSKAMLEVGKDIYRPPSRKVSRKLKAIKPVRRKKPSNLEFSQDVRRFKHSYMLQQQIQRFIVERQNKNHLPPVGFPLPGYVPDAYDFGGVPCCYFSQEYIENGIPLIEYVRTHSDDDNLKIFLKIVELIELKIHGYGVAHCDLAPRNLEVVRSATTGEDVPVLYDFGIAKAEQLPDITMPTSQLGSILYSSGEQMRDSQHRGYLDDIHSLAKILWVIVTRNLPSLEGVLVRIGKDGKRRYDEDTVNGKFDRAELPEEFRPIFDKALTFGYKDISEFRGDLQEIIYFKKMERIQQAPCPGTDDLQKILVFLEELLNSYRERFL
jgi:tRNA A-37 threonylcarbamoyl transferase component Bud32